MSNKILIKRGSSAPTTSDLDNYEIAYDTSANKLYIRDGSDIIPFGAIVDEDNFASDDANRAPSQQSVKAYIASELAAAGAGDITSVVAGSGLTGGSTAGDATLNIGAGTGIDVAADAISVDVSDFMANGANNYIVTATGTDAMNAESNLQFGGSHLKLLVDNGKFLAGADEDAYFMHSGTHAWLNNSTGNLYIRNQTDDGQIIMQTDDGSGGTTTYMSLKGNEQLIRILKSTRYSDNIAAQFGTGNDFSIRHDGSHNIMKLTNGNLYFRDQSNNNIFQIYREGGGIQLSEGDLKIPATSKLYLDGGGDTYIHEPSANQIGFVTGGNTRLLILPHKTYINSTGANGLVMNNDEGTTSNSGRIFFEGTSTSSIFQSGGALSFRTGATTGSSSGTQRFYIDTSGATVVGNLTVSGNSFMNYGLVVNEGGNDADFRVESVNNANMLKVDASADAVLTAKLIDSATHIGTVGGHGLEGNQLSTTDWANLPVGFGGMMRSGNQSYGNPGSNYFLFHKIANRDSGGGWGGIALGYNSNAEFYVGHTTVSSSYATWSKVWNEANDGSGSGLDADLLDGLQGSAYYSSSNQPDISDITGVIEGTSFSGTYPVVFNIGGANRLFSEDSITFNGSTNVLAISGNTVWHAGNDGSGSGLDADLLDGVNASGFPRRGNLAENTASSITTFNSNAAIDTSNGNQSGLQVYQDTVGEDAFMTFHVANDYALYFGLDGGTNDLAVGGWSKGANSYKVWHAGNDGGGSGLDADKLDGLQGSSYWTKGGSWLGDLGSNGYSRVQGVSNGGGEFVLALKNNQLHSLIDGSYFAYEGSTAAGGGFWSSYNSAYGTATGFKATGISTIAVKQQDGGNADLHVTNQITTDYGVRFNNGNTDFMFYNNTGDNSFYLRDLTNAQQLQTWTTSSTTIHKPLYVTGDVRTSDGTAANPAFRFTSDPNTGMYRLGDDDLGFSAGGSLKYGILNGLNRFYSNVVVGPNNNNSKPYIQYKDGYDTASTPSYSWYYDNGCGMGHPAGSTIAFSTGSAERLRINNSGLSVSGDVTINGNTTMQAGHYITAHNESNYAKYRMYGGSSAYSIGMYSGNAFGGLNDWAMTFTFNDEADRGFLWRDTSHSQGQGAMSLTTNGKLAVAHSVRLGYGESDTTTPGATYRLDVSGSIGATADVVAYVSSDKRLKDNIKNIANPLDKLNKLNGVEFDWNDKQDLYKGHDIGVIAQEVEEVLPEIVDTREDGHKAVKYDRMVALLIEVAKEQQQQINELKEKLNG
tara:strand:- start:6776 stop:10573 length:3798 start_codon:yes stop_codon:yes gene_type:complete